MVSQFSHGGKWLHGFSREERAQMVATSRGHFYIYEPVQLISGTHKVPTHFYQQDGKLWAKCLQLYITQHPTSSMGEVMEIKCEANWSAQHIETVSVGEFYRGFDRIRRSDGRLLKETVPAELFREFVPL